MAFYESVFMARQDLSTAQVEKLTSEFAEIIKKNGGKVATTESWGLRTLAYPVKKNRKAHYVMFQIEGNGKVVAELERNFRIQEDIIRFMTISIEALSKEPSVMMTPDDDSRDSRDTRESRDTRAA